MKVNKFLIIGFLLLTIFSIGIASASDNITNDVVDCDNEDVLGYSYYDDDFYITVEENYTQDIEDWDSHEIAYISSYGDDNGTFDILVDDVKKESLEITNGQFSVDDDYRYFVYVYPKDLNLDLGTYNIKINYNNRNLIDTDITLKEKEDFDIFIQNPYYCENDYWDSPSFIIIDSNHCNNGTLEIYVNGTRKITYVVNNGDFSEIEDCSNKSRYLAPSDLLDSYGIYNIQINFTENGATRTLYNGEVTVAEYAPTINPSLYVYLDLYTVNIPEDNIAHIYLPREATGTLTVSYNNVQNKAISYSKGYGQYYINCWNLNHLGENTLTFTYTGDDFGVLTATATCTVQPSIAAPSYVSLGEEFSISITTHNWVNGQFNVYEYINNQKGKLISSGTIKNSIASVKLSGTNPGLNRYYLEFDYSDGDYPLIQEVYVVKNSENINVEMVDEIEVGDDLNITVSAPADNFTFVQITVDDGDTDFVMLENGHANKTVSALNKGYHTVKVFYENRYYADGEWVWDVFLNTFTVNVGVKTNMTSSDVVCDYGSGENLTVTLKDVNGNALADKNISINISGTVYNKITDSSGQAVLPINLDGGNYVAVISFNGGAGYLSSYVNSSVTVNKISTVLAADNVIMYYGENKNIILTLSDYLGNAIVSRNVSLSISGVNYKKTTDSMGQIFIPVSFGCGSYKMDIDFLGDSSFNSSSTSCSIIVNKVSTKLTGKGFTVIYNNAKNLVATLKDANGNVLVQKTVIIYLNNNKYIKSTDKNGQVKLPITLPVKKYVANINFAGDNNYLPINLKVNIVINKATPKLTVKSKKFKAKSKTKKVTAILKDNKGKSIKNMKITLKINKKNYSAKTNKNGVATFKIKLTKKGTYKAVYMFKGNVNFKTVKKSVKIKIK